MDKDKGAFKKVATEATETIIDEIQAAAFGDDLEKAAILTKMKGKLAGIYESQKNRMKTKAKNNGMQSMRKLQDQYDMKVRQAQITTVKDIQSLVAEMTAEVHKVVPEFEGRDGMISQNSARLMVQGFEMMSRSQHIKTTLNERKMQEEVKQLQTRLKAHHKDNQNEVERLKRELEATTNELIAARGKIAGLEESLRLIEHEKDSEVRRGEVKEKDQRKQDIALREQFSG